jgi:hypothetical protein
MELAVSKEQYKARLKICEACEHKNSLQICSLCGCIIVLKARAGFTDCPANKWEAVENKE